VRSRERLQGQFWLSWRMFWTIIALLLATIYSTWLVRATTPKTDNARYGDNIADFYLTDVLALEFNQQGQLIHRLVSPKVVHIPANDTLLLRNPDLTLYSESVPVKSPWRITALHGKTIQNDKQAWLWGNVVLHQPPSAENKDSTILTSQLTIYPDKNMAETYAPVTVLEPGLEVHSVGMRAYFKEKRVDLLSRAQGVYDVNEAK